DVLAEHNRLREIHGARPLRRSVALGRDARAWARELARSRALRSHPTVPHGQNRCVRVGSIPRRKVTNCWYADRLAYDYNNPGFQQGTGNFSQLVWRSSLDLGVGLACDGRGMFVAVAFYSPAGNLPYAMSYRDNVLPPHTQGMAKGQG
uniref:SCP domain-containing protein n=1 Tax=Petromyzon marinus TaxID=7757 RepID=S4RAI2_PETMA